MTRPSRLGLAQKQRVALGEPPFKNVTVLRPSSGSQSVYCTVIVIELLLTPATIIVNCTGPAPRNWGMRTTFT